MYKFNRNHQISLFTDFNQPLGMKLNPNNRWVKKATIIPWDEYRGEIRKTLSERNGYAYTLDGSHGRIEKRECFVCNDIGWLNNCEKWTDIHGIVIDLLGNWRSVVWRSNFVVRQSQFSAGILAVLQGKLAKHDGKRASRTVLRKFPRRSNDNCNS